MKTSVAEVEDHRKICSFRPVDCPSYLCKEKVPFEHVVDHILNKCKHSYSKGAYKDVENSSVTSMFNVLASNLATATMDVTMYKWNDKFFFLNMEVGNELHRKFYMQMLGTDEECKKYTVEISLKAKTGKCAVTFCDNPFPIEVTEEDLNAGGMLVTNAMMKKISIPLVNRPDRITYSLVLSFGSVNLED